MTNKIDIEHQRVEPGHYIVYYINESFNEVTINLETSMTLSFIEMEELLNKKLNKKYLQIRAISKATE